MLRRAQIVFRNGYSVIDCIVLDLSEGGARLKLSNLLAIPSRFELRIENSTPQIARITYREPQVAGVAFVFDEAS